MLESNVTSLELSRKLCELGIKQESVFFWEYMNDSCYGIKYVPYCVNPMNTHGLKHYSAFGSSELLALLPIHVKTEEEDPFNTYRLNVTSSFIVNDPINLNLSKTYIANYKGDTYSLDGGVFSQDRSLTKNIWDENPANALAKMLIFLYEQGLIKNVL